LVQRSHPQRPQRPPTAIWSRRFGLAWIAELIGWLARRWL
jgi:hypothetical protein